MIVAALVAVNAGGDIIDPATGRVVAGTRTADGNGFADVRKQLRDGTFAQPRPAENTTLAVVATNATLTKAQAGRMASMAHDGFARAIVPAHTMSDGDTIFALATGTHSGAPNVSLIGALERRDGAGRDPARRPRRDLSSRDIPPRVTSSSRP